MVFFKLDSIIANETRGQIQETVNNTLRLMKNLTSSRNGIGAGDLSSSLGVLEKIVTVTNATGFPIEKEVMYWNYLRYNPSFLHSLLKSVRQKNCEKSAKTFPALSNLNNCFEPFHSKVPIIFFVEVI